MIDKNVAYIEE